MLPLKSMRSITVGICASRLTLARAQRGSSSPGGGATAGRQRPSLLQVAPPGQERWPGAHSAVHVPSLHCRPAPQSEDAEQAAPHLSAASPSQAEELALRSPLQASESSAIAHAGVQAR
jgi:hypothetical protein